MKKLFLQIILPLIAIVGILGFITIFNPIQQQEAACANGAKGPGGNWCESDQFYTIDNGGIIVYIDPQVNTCSSSITSFSSSMNIHTGGTHPGAYTVHWGWLGNFCTDGGQCDNSNTTRTSTTTSGSFTGDQGTTASVSIAPSGQFAGLACGGYQTDFGFYVTRNSDGASVGGISLRDLNSQNNNASFCSTGKACVTPTNTPVPPTNTPVPPTGTPVPPTNTPIPTVGPTNTPVPTDCDGDTDAGDPSEAQECATPTNTPVPPTNTPVPSNNGCAGTQTGTNNNSNCNSNTQTQTQTQNNNQTVNISLGNSQQQHQQQVLAAATVPTQLPSTGSEGQILLGLLTLIPVGWKIRKLI